MTKLLMVNTLEKTEVTWIEAWITSDQQVTIKNFVQLFFVNWIDLMLRIDITVFSEVVSTNLHEDFVSLKEASLINHTN